MSKTRSLLWLALAPAMLACGVPDREPLEPAVARPTALSTVVAPAATPIAPPDGGVVVTAAPSNVAPSAPLRGFVDLHTHPMSNLAFGGKLLYGGIDAAPGGGSYLPADPDCNHWVRATSEAQALGHDESVHGPVIPFVNWCGDDIRSIFVAELQDHLGFNNPSADASGSPNFPEWPKWNDGTHQKMWVDWIRRSWQNGLRVMVALATNNKTMADMVKGDNEGDLSYSDDKASADLQLSELKSFVARHGDFMEVAYTSADVQRIVTAHRLAVVLGVEIDHIGDFQTTTWVGTPPTTPQSLPPPQDTEVIAEIDRLYAEGARYIFPVHLIDNAFGGTAVYESLFNVSNMRESGSGWNLTCADATEKVTFQFKEPDAKTEAAEIAKLGRTFEPPLGPPSCGQKNALGLTGPGRVAIKEMMRLGMLIDVDHMSEATFNDTFQIAAAIGYPLNSGHNGVRGVHSDPASNSERALTYAQYQEIGALHGMAGVGTANLDAWQWLAMYRMIMDAMTSSQNPNPAAGFGTDTNGLAPGMMPRAGSNVQYTSTFPPSTDGMKTWNYNTDGVAHYGMLPDFLMDAAANPDGGGMVDGSVMNGADYFFHTWQLSEMRSVEVEPSTSAPAVGKNANGTLEVFVRNPTDGSLSHDWQTSAGGAWAGWDGLGGGLTSAPQVAANLDGRLEVFVRGTDSALWHIWQNAPGVWSGWQGLGGVLTSTPAVAKNKDGRLEVFVRGTDDALYHIWQNTPGGGWSAWQKLGGVLLSDPAVGQNADGRLEVFARGSDGSLEHIWQQTPGVWSGWASLGGVLTSNPVVGSNSDGRLEVFVRGTDLALYHNWQLAPGVWSGWADLGGGVVGDPTVGRNDDGHGGGRLEVFVRGTDMTIYHNYQTSPGGAWSGWSQLSPLSLNGFPLPASFTSDVGVGLNADRRLEIFAQGSFLGYEHLWQQSPNDDTSWMSFWFRL
jgi:hypothetical protein